MRHPLLTISLLLWYLTDSLPEMSQEVNSDFKAKLDWSMLTNEDVMLYFGRTDGNFNLIN